MREPCDRCHACIVCTTARILLYAKPKYTYAENTALRMRTALTQASKSRSAGHASSAAASPAPAGRGSASCSGGCAGGGESAGGCARVRSGSGDACPTPAPAVLLQPRRIHRGTDSGELVCRPICSRRTHGRRRTSSSSSWRTRLALGPSGGVGVVGCVASREAFLDGTYCHSTRRCGQWHICCHPYLGFSV
jgi:hypothetical protein